MSVETNIDEINTSSDEEYFEVPIGGVSLADLLPEYPSPDDDELAAKLFALKEFRELQEPFGKGPGDRLFNHQEAVARWVSPLTGVATAIVITDPGMGKTSVGVQFCEQGIYEKGRKVLFLSSSENINNNIKKEILKTVAGKYKVPAGTASSVGIRKETSSNKPIVLAKKVTVTNAISGANPVNNTLKSNGIAGGDKAVTLNTEIQQGNLSLTDYYQFYTHKRFAKIIRANFDPETDSLKKEFLDRYRGVTIVIDEPHHIRATSEGSKGEHVITDTALGKVFGGMDRVQWLSGIRADYRAYALFLHAVKDIRKCGLTATPATDKVSEYFFTMNLFLPTHRIFVASSRSFIQYLNMDKDELKRTIYEHCKGYVAYAHAKYKAKRIEVGEQIGTNITEEGDSIPFSTTYIPCVMSETQYEVIRAIEQEEGVPAIGEVPEDILEIDDPDQRENAFMNKARNASNFIFPYNGRYVPGNENRNKIKAPTTTSSRTAKSGTKKSPPKQKKTIKTATPTKAKSAQKKTASPTKKTSQQKKAKVPSVFDYYMRGDPSEGWDFVESPNDPKRQADIDALKNIVRSLDPNGGLPSIAPKYAKIIEYLKRDDKRVTYIYCPFVIGSGVAALYVCIMQYEGFEPYKGQDIIRLNNENERYRAAGKPIPKRIAVITSKIGGGKGQELLEIFNSPANRYGALIYAIIGSPSSGEAISFFNVRRNITLSYPWNAPTKKQVDGRAFRIGKGHEAFNEEESTVEIVNLAAVAPPGEYENDVTPDLRVMMIAEAKGREIATVIRDTKECTFDGLINHKLNQRPDLKGNTLDTDYAPSTYKVISGDITIDGKPIKAKKLRTGNYDLYYDSERKRPIEEITKYLREKTSATFAELSENLNFERTALLFALDTLIQTRTRIQDSFGSYAYIVEKDNLIFLQPEYKDPDPLFIHYQQCKYISIPGESGIYREEARPSVDNFYSAVLNDPASVTTLFNDLYGEIQTRIGLLYEGWFDGTYNFDSVPEAERVILDRFKTSTGIIQVDNLDDVTGIGISGETEEYGNVLFYHKLYYVGQNVKAGDTSKYAKGARLKPAVEMPKGRKRSNLRVYDGEKQAWRYATDEEDKLIVELENKLDSEIKDSMSNNEIWGIKYVLDGSFSLVFPKEEQRRETKTTGKEGSKKEDQRFRVRGQSANNSNKSLMFWVMWYLSQLSDPPRYYLDYVYNEEEAKKSKEIWLGDIRPDPNTKKQNSRKYREGRNLPTLKEISENLPMLSFFRWAFTSNLPTKSVNPDKIEQTTSYQIRKRLEELDLLVER